MVMAINNNNTGRGDQDFESSLEEKYYNLNFNIKG